MDQQDDLGYVPDGFRRPDPRTQGKTRTISPARAHWRLPAVATSMAVVAAMCLHGGSTAHAAERPKLAGVSAHSGQGVSLQAALPMQLPGNTDTTTSGSTGGSQIQGGVHGAFNLYDGAGGGIEFWFDPSTGELTVAVGVGVGEGGGGVLGSYASGTAPEPGVYVYANADLAAGTVSTVNVGGTYSLTNGVFVGSVATTVQGRTLTISSDGTSTFDVNVNAAEGAEGFNGSIGLNYTFKFNAVAVVDYIWDAIKNFFTGDWFLGDDDETGDDTSEYSDDGVADGSADDATTGDSSDDGSSDDGGDSGDGGGGGGGWGDDSDDDGCAAAYSVSYHAEAGAPTVNGHTIVIVPAKEAPPEDDGSDDGCE